ncbi:MAG: SBBP repeat-containing protein [Bacteroidia bacterium]
MGNTQAQNPNAQQALSKADKHFFIENKGQWHSDVLYLCRMGGLDAWITKYGVNYTFYKIEKNPAASAERTNRLPKGKFDHDELENSILLGHRVLMKLQNHNPAPQREGKQQQEGYYNYFTGNDPSKHATYVGLYKEAVVKDVYEGIDLRYYFDKGSLRYDYVVHPDADPSKIAFTLEGQNDAYIKNGNLYFTTRFGEVAMAELHTYQGNTTVASRFEKQGNTWKIAVGNYDKTQDLIIDPLIYSTYIGGSHTDQGNSIAIDGSGNAYVTGYTSSADYDITAGAFQTTMALGGGDANVFVTKLNSTGTSLIYSTYIGGSDWDYGRSIAIDGSGNAYVTGRTKSTDYDITTGAFQITYGGGDYDVFVTKLNSTGTALVYSTYLGGSNYDEGLSIAIDSSGHAYVTGKTESTDYNITAGAFQTTYGGGTSFFNGDVFVTKLNSTGTALVYSTYLGGSSADGGYGISIDGSGNAYVTGETMSTDYDITPGAFQTTNGGSFGGSFDVFVTKLNSTGTALVYSTYIGGSGDDRGRSIAIDGSGNVYVTGSTGSTNYDVTPGAFQTNFGGNGEVFVTKLNSTGTALMYSTYLGGSSDDEGSSIAIDGSGNAYVTGWTESTDYDITAGAFQTTFGGGTNHGDVFVTKLNSTGSALVYSTYIGGILGDEGRSIAIDSSGYAYVTGWTVSTDYDTTAGAFQTTNGGGTSDVFVTKLDLSGTTSVNETLQNISVFSLYPNPNSGSFKITVDKPAVFELMDITGRIIEVFEAKEKETQVNVSLPTGMYFVREKMSGGVKKMVVE